ncbi:transglutaminase family protein [Geomesophilobacter sediminis]|nr:transglutaminase family protein [Geomesophilobacter sediminis]
MSFSVQQEVAQLTFTFALPANFSNRGVDQQVDNFHLSVSPRPASVKDKTDEFGNRFKVVTWQGLTQDASVALTFEPRLKAQLSAMESSAPFPLSGVPAGEQIFLKPTPLVQADDPEMAATARSLTARATNEFEAVNAVLNYVADKVKYTYNPKSYDALYTLKTGSGNCQNYAHLSMALLRSVGIPARIVGGISLKEPWKVPLDKGSSLVQSMGQGGHAWMEIYFPDLGWLSYDPQQSKQFTSTRHVKQTHGLDSHDINDSWSASPYLPQYSESVDAKFLDDQIALKPMGSTSLPRPYLMSNAVKAEAPQGAVTPRPAEPLPLPLPEKPTPPPPPPAAGQTVEFGNMEFPNMVENFRVEGNQGVRVLDKETSAYATSVNVYAQAFQVDHPLALSSIALAMHKFGGDGSVFIDIVTDDHGKPSLPTVGAGFRSRPVQLDDISRRPGYYWVEFPFERGEVSLKKGKYWVILRKSGEAIMNWFYLPGKPYSTGEDTRSTAKGYRWEDVLNWDFVFKVKGQIIDKKKKKGGDV